MAIIMTTVCGLVVSRIVGMDVSVVPSVLQDAYEKAKRDIWFNAAVFLSAVIVFGACMFPVLVDLLDWIDRRKREH